MALILWTISLCVYVPLLLTFGAHQCRLSSFASIPTVLVEGQTLLSRPSNHLCTVRQQPSARQQAHTVDMARIGIRDQQRPRYRVNGQEVLMSGVVTVGQRENNKVIGISIELEKNNLD